MVYRISIFGCGKQEKASLFLLIWGNIITDDPKNK
jgi:hypothetical protein